MSEHQKDEVISEGKVENEIEFQHLEDEAGLWSMDFDGSIGRDGAGIGLWICNPFQQKNKVPNNITNKRLISKKYE